MRKIAVRNGLWVVNGGILLVTAATFFHSHLADLMNLSAAAEDKLVSFGFFWGGMAASFGIVIAVAGVVRSGGRQDVRLAPVIGVLILSIVLFFSLLGSSFTGRRAPTLHPGDTITI